MPDKKECDITVQSNVGLRPTDAVWVASALTLGEIEVDDVQDMVNKLRNASKNCCIKRLTIIGHGSPGYQEIGTDTINVWDTSTWKSVFDQIKDFLCPEALVKLHGCDIGADEDGRKFVQLIAENLGCWVIAPTADVDQFGRILRRDGEPIIQLGYPGRPRSFSRPIPAPKDAQKKQKPKPNKRRALMYERDARTHFIETSQIQGFAIIRRDETPDQPTLRLRYNSSRIFTKFVESLDVFEPFSGNGMPFAVDAHLYFWLKGEPENTIPITRRSYLVGGYRYLAMGGDWKYVYRLADGMHLEIRRYGRYPTLDATLEKYAFLREPPVGSPLRVHSLFANLEPDERDAVRALMRTRGSPRPRRR